MNEYEELLKSKIKIAENTGFEINESALNPILKPHQKGITRWAIQGGRRGIFASFGLGKTFMQLEIARLVAAHTQKPFLIGMPLGVRYEFQIDARTLGIAAYYVKDQAEADAMCETWKANNLVFFTNYERIRDGKFNAEKFGGVSFDEASCLRGLDTETTNYILEHFSKVPFRFVATATPSPNEYTEILNYAQFLGIMDRGQALTRFFQRDSTKAGNLTLYPNKEKEFWMWVSSWAAFITKPSDMGFDNTGYDLPEMKIIHHRVNVKERELKADRDGNLKMFADAAASLQDAAREKRISLEARVEKMLEIVNQDPESHFLLWHNLEAERAAIEKILPQAKTVYGKQDTDEREEYLTGFGQGKFQYLATKPEIAGSGCNFQRYCHKAIYVGIDYKFNDFIQSIHRIYRFLQTKQVEIHIICTDAEEQILKTLQAKWRRHDEMIAHMTEIIRQYGLNNIALKADLSRSIDMERKEISGKNFRAIHNDNILEVRSMAKNSVDLIVTSIPFSDQYEYSESYRDFGHNNGDREFFNQMDFLTPELLRVTKPGRIACIHVKDRIRYSYQNGVGFTTLSDFSGATVAHFQKHGWNLLGKHTIPTDVVAENNQTYRLGWSEQCKDGTKMGCGLPEYLLVFRKTPTDTANAYADTPVVKSKAEYTRARWQLDAHAVWKTSGNRLLNPDELRQLDLSQIGHYWKEIERTEPYDYERHVQICEALDSIHKLPASFMAIPPMTYSSYIWGNVSRMHTLNSSQARKKQEKHVCPLQFDIVDRCITRYSNEGDTVMDPFGGIMTVPYRAIKLKRYGIGIELNEQYWKDGVGYCKAAELEVNVPSLFDVIQEEKVA